MRRIAILLVFVMGLFSLPAVAAVLSWDLPTERVNGLPLAAEEIEKVTIYKDGEVYRELPPNSTQLQVPGVCKDVLWSATVTAAGFTSSESDPVIQPIDMVGCVPKPPAGLRF